MRGNFVKRNISAKYLQKRLIFFRVFLILVVGGVLFQLLRLSLFKPEPYASLAERQHVINVKLFGKRGTIYDRYGRPLAFTGEGITLEVIDTISEEDSVKLARWGINLNRFKLHARVENVDPMLWDSLLGIRSLFKTLRNSIRYYPCGEACRNIVGSVRGARGISGLEYGYDSVLAPKSITVKYLRDASGKIYPMPVSFTKRPQPADGKDLHTTLDMDMQRISYHLLKRRVEYLGAKGGMVIVADVKTGDILVYAAVGSLDKNRVFNYEPGSNFKIVVYTEGLERGLDIYDTCGIKDGRLPLGKGVVIRDIKPLGEKDTWFWAFAKSSNACAAKLALEMEKLRRNGIYRRALLYGFGEPANIGLPEDPIRLERPSTWKSWRKVKIANMAIGQGIYVNPIQMVRAYTVIAREGEFVFPKIVKGPVKHYRIRTVADRKTFLRLKDLLVGVVDSGTGRWAKVKGVKVAGKTGTAQKYERKTGRYSFVKSLTSFIGFFPADSPDYVVYVLIDEPQRFTTGGTAAAPLFRKIAEAIVKIDSVRRRM